MLWSKLEEKDIDCSEWEKRILFFDPTNIPNVYDVRPFQRHQPLSMYQLWPKLDGICGCGCGRELTGRRTRWATDECEKFAVAIRFIVAGYFDTIKKYLRLYHGWECKNCGCQDKGHNMGKNGVVAWIKIDHIIPVKLGGGACWLSNYQLICHDCHVGKTNKDFNWKKK